MVHFCLLKLRAMVTTHFPLLLNCLLWLVIQVYCQEYSSYDYAFPVGRFCKRQDQGPIVVTGAELVNGTVPIRLEIRKMKQDVKQWHLYLLSMSLLQYTSQTQELSWYQIAGRIARHSWFTRSYSANSTL
jgi:hypothetical protein